MYNKLKEMRYRKNLTASEVASRVGISKPFYCQIENQKRRLLYSTAIRIADVFGVKPDYLFYDDTINNEKEEN